MSRIAVAGGGLLAILAAPVVLVMLALTGGASSGIGVPSCGSLQTPEVAELDDEQSRNAAVIVTVGRDTGVPAFGLQVALATAMQESSLRNLDYGDRDSLGLFQQQPSAGWGTRAQVQDPVYAARAFFGGPEGPNRGEPPGLLDVPGWEQMSLTEAAQAVQRSAYPDAYARWEAAAAVWLTDLLSADGRDCEDAARSDAGPGEWVVPIAGDYTITARFGQDGEHWANRHTGVDMAAPIDREVVAAADGRVTFAGWDGPYGLKVEISHPDGTRTWYAHLSRIAVAEAEQVAAGQVISQVGVSGNVTGPHLHYEVRSDRPDGRPVDPAPWMSARGAPLS